MGIPATPRFWAASSQPHFPFCPCQVMGCFSKPNWKSLWPGRNLRLQIWASQAVWQWQVVLWSEADTTHSRLDLAEAFSLRETAALRE